MIVIPSTPLMALGMCATGILRGVGDARRAMYVTLFSAVATAILDPILIFWLDLGLDGAAISTVLSRFVMLVVGWYGARTVHNLLAFPTRARLVAAAKAVLRHRHSRSPHAARDADRQRLCDGRGGALRRRCGGRHGGDRALGAGRLRGPVRRVRRDRPDPRAKSRCPEIRPHLLDRARRPRLHCDLCADCVGADGAVRRTVSPTCSAPTLWPAKSSSSSAISSPAAIYSTARCSSPAPPSTISAIPAIRPY